MKFSRVSMLALMMGLSACSSLPYLDGIGGGAGGSTGAAPGGEVQLAPLPTGTVTRIAFGSCADQSRPQPFWDVIGADNPDLFLLIGDAVYADYRDGERVEEPSLDHIAYAYEQLGAKEPFQRFRHDVPILVTWDDHDMGKNDAGGEFALKQGSKDIMLDFFGRPEGSGLDVRDGMYQSYVFGPEGQRVQVILLDTRWFRSELKRTDDWGAKGKERYLPDASPKKTMLGDAQWAWLEEQLKVPADLRLLVSSQQVIADNHGWEAWRNLPLERQKLFDLIDTTGAEGVVLLSGDRHVGGLYENSEDTPYPLVELTSSALNLAFTNEPDETCPYQVGHLFGPANYGLLDIDWGSETVKLRLMSDAGVEVRGITLPLETLREARPARLTR